MELAVSLARAAESSVFDFLKLPVIRLNHWAQVVEKVLKREEENYGRP